MRWLRKTKGVMKMKPTNLGYDTKGSPIYEWGINDLIQFIENALNDYLNQQTYSRYGYNRNIITNW